MPSISRDSGRALYRALILSRLLAWVPLFWPPPAISLFFPSPLTCTDHGLQVQLMQAVCLADVVIYQKGFAHSGRLPHGRTEETITWDEILDVIRSQELIRCSLALGISHWLHLSRGFYFIPFLSCLCGCPHSPLFCQPWTLNILVTYVQSFLVSSSFPLN